MEDAGHDVKKEKDTGDPGGHLMANMLSLRLTMFGFFLGVKLPEVRNVGAIGH